MSRKSLVRNGADLFAVLVEQLSAVLALGIGFPALNFTGGSLSGNTVLVCVAACYRYRTGVGKVSVSSFYGDGCSTFADAGYCSGCCVYGSNRSVVRCKRNSFFAASAGATVKDGVFV